MSDTTKAFCASAIQTFLATFLTVAGGTIASGVEWSSAFWIGIAITASRAALKAIFQTTSIPILGGKKE